jgi:excisionase family DNA binding protein
MEIAYMPDPKDFQPHDQLLAIKAKWAFTLVECALLTGLKVCALRDAIAAGELAFIRSGKGGRYLIRPETLEKFLCSQERREAQ